MGQMNMMRKPLLGGSLVVSLLATPTQAPFAPITAAAKIEADMPAYEGRTLESWLKDLQCTPCGPAYDPAANAIRQMGTRAIPYLLHAIEGANADAGLSVAAIRELGPVARTAIPALAELLKNRKVKSSRRHGPRVPVVGQTRDRSVIQYYAIHTSKCHGRSWLRGISSRRICCAPPH
jgi:hypothetical protein